MSVAQQSTLPFQFGISKEQTQAPPQLTALVVDPSLDDLMIRVAAMATAGFQVTAAEGFLRAKPLLGIAHPQILVTAARLGMYNGLHLVLRGKALQPRLAAIVTSEIVDSVLRDEVESAGATFILTPLPSPHLIAAILQTLYREPDGPPIRPPFERRVADRRGSVVPLDAERRITERRRLAPLNPFGMPQPSS